MFRGLGHTLRFFAADLAPMILFMVIVLTTGNIFLATGIGIGVGLAQVGWQLARRLSVGALQWASLGLVVAFGTATLITRDPRFVMFKPTAIHLILGATMMRRGWMDRYVPADMLSQAKPMLDVYGYVWAGLMFLTAALNLALVWTVSPKVWAQFNLFFSPISIIGLFVAGNVVMRARMAVAQRRGSGEGVLAEG
jgi:intracellular septation protein A